MSDYSMADISSLLQSIGRDGGVVAKNSTSRKNNIDLDMTDFLQLMIVQLQSQSIDNTMDTSEMMNQLVQMQMISAITNMTETNIMSYASSLVGKEVTIGIVDGNSIKEVVVTVTGTAMSDGSQVIFGTDKDGNVGTYNLSQIMAVGRLPDIEGIDQEESGGNTEGTTDPTGSTGGAGGTTSPTEPDGAENKDHVEGGDEDNNQIPGDGVDKPVSGPDEPTDENGGGDDENKDEVVNPTEGVG